VVPGPDDLGGVFWRRSTGLGVSGGYPLTPAAQFGLGFQIQRDSTREAATNGQETVVDKAELNPSFSFDSTRGIGAEMRGSRLFVAHSWRGTPLLDSISSTRPVLQ